MSRWSHEDERPMSFEEFREMRLSFEREVRQLHANGYDWRKGPMPKPKKASRRELQYLAWCDYLRQLVEDLFG